jgi:hypothetical protein
MSWTVEFVAGKKCDRLLATVRVNGEGVEIWDALKGKCLRTIVCNQLSMLEISPNGLFLAATSLDNGRRCLYNI